MNFILAVAEHKYALLCLSASEGSPNSSWDVILTAIDRLGSKENGLLAIVGTVYYCSNAATLGIHIGFWILDLKVLCSMPIA